MATILIAVCLVFLYKADLAARDFGVRGHTLPILEEDFLAFIHQKMSNLTREEISKLLGDIQEHYESMIKEPAPVENLTETKAYRRFNFDPTITVAVDITDYENRIIVKKGTTINPLHLCSLGEDLLFFDSTNQKHLKWAKEQEGKTKWILVKGRPIELEEHEQRKVFFDQNGILTTKLGIQHIPSKVTQNRDLIQIEEILVE